MTGYHARARFAELDCFLLADDLTGACDAAVHFAMRGRPTAVVVAPRAEPAGAAVIAISTESRDLEPAAIRSATVAAAATLARPPQLLIKKIDSTLRGHAGVEIAAALDAFACDAAIVCPAFPGLHRIVKAGRLHVDGAVDFEPIEIAVHLGKQGVEPCAHARPEEIAGAIASGARVVILDALSDADLDRIVAAALALDLRMLWAGSGGLAAALARALPSAPPSHPPFAGGPVLFAIGSDHRVTLAQQAALLKERHALLLDAAQTQPECIDAALRRGQHVLLRIPRGRIQADRLEELVTAAPASALALSGGDTASLFCRAARVERIDLCDEIVPGIPRGVIRGGAFNGLPVATKSGGFGEPDALIQVADFFNA